MTSETLRIMTMTSEGAAVFPNAESPAELSAWTFDAERMGPTRIDGTLEYPSCLDDVWTGNEFVEFRGERYILQSTPASSKDTSTVAYKHTLSFLSERDIVLSSAYFYDAVSDASTADDKYKSNDTKVIFHGTLEEFATRLNQSMAYSGLDYSVVIDAGIVTEAKQVSFEDKYIFEVLQESFDIYNVPFYFVGNVCHFGYTDNAIPHVFKYDGADGDLLAVKRNGKGNKIVRRCTGVGSSDNIPHYYPNLSPKGDISAEVSHGASSAFEAHIINYEKFAEKVDIDGVITNSNASYKNLEVEFAGAEDYYPGRVVNNCLMSYSVCQEGLWIEFEAESVGEIPLTIRPFVQSTLLGENTVNAEYEFYLWGLDVFRHRRGGSSRTVLESHYDRNNLHIFTDSETVIIPISDATSEKYYTVHVSVSYRPVGRYANNNKLKLNLGVNYEFGSSTGWTMNGEAVSLHDLGLRVDGTPAAGDTITQKLGRRLAFSEVLLPSIYRQTEGAERFYNAISNTLMDPDTGKLVVFENEYIAANPGEHKEKFEEIKPTIKGITNADGQIMAQFIDVAFDENDNDDTDEEGNMLHPYFYVKLPKFDGEYGFNLFDSAIETAEMTFVMDSGPCAPCAFRVMVGKETQKNLVQVDSSGNLLRDSAGNVRMNNESWLERQNDTRNYEVWIALEKEDSTFGVIMPNALQNYRPSAGNTFVITGILLPNSYILKAEDDLEAEIIRFMIANNPTQFGFSVDFSRISSEELPEIYAKIDQNARLQVEYNGKTELFYVSHFSYSVTEGVALPEVKVELSDTVTVNRTSLQNTVNAVKKELLTRMQGMDILAMCLPYFIRKDMPDRTPHPLGVGGVLTAEKGVQFGKDFADGPTGFGGKVDEHGNGWFRNIFVAESLEASEYRYNRVAIDIGNKWNGPGGGIIEDVTPDHDEYGNPLNTGVLTLKLEEGEIGAIAVDDICQGIYHDAVNPDGNSYEDYDDGKGNFHVAGFYTCYFRITEILETGRNSKVAYAIRPESDNWHLAKHPHSLMHFIAYGNFSDKKRQTSRYSTRTYERYLKDVSSWEFTADNIGAQFGDLTNLSVFGMQMDGYSAYLNNIYMTGTIQQFEHIPLRMEIDTEGDNFLAYGESVVATCTVFKGWDDVTESVKSWSVIRDSGDPSDDAAWQLKEKVKDFHGQLEIKYTKDENDLGNAALSTLFTFTAILTDGDTAEYTLTI